MGGYPFVEDPYRGGVVVVVVVGVGGRGGGG